MAQRLKSLLGSNQQLRPLLTKAQALSALQHHFTSVAPPLLAQSSQVLSLQSGTLSIAASNAASAAKLRQLAPELVIMLKNRGCEVSGIRVKVQVMVGSRHAAHVPRKLGKAAQNALNELRQGMDDSPLKSALGKLAGTKS